MPFKMIVFLKLKEIQFKVKTLYENQFKGGTLKKKITPKLKN
jgi:hypothetical protein